MDDADNPVLVYTTCPSMEVAEQIGGELVVAKLAACANVLPGMRSIYVWKGERQSDDEVVLILKTRQSRTEALLNRFKELHPYETPAALTFRATDGLPDFMRWIAEETQ